MSQMNLDEAMATVKGYLVDGKKRCDIMVAWEIICSHIRESQKPSANTGVAEQIAAEMDTVLVRINKPHGEIDWPFIINGWRQRLRHA